MTIRLEYVTKSREDVMEALWREFQMVLNGYTSYTSDFYEDYLELKRRDEIETQVGVFFKYWAHGFLFVYLLHSRRLATTVK